MICRLISCSHSYRSVIYRQIQKYSSSQFPHHSSKTAMDKPKILLLSSSTVHGYGFLEYAQDDINEFLSRLENLITSSSNVDSVLFIPYALMDHDKYLEQVSKAFSKWDIQVEGIHKHEPTQAINNAQAVFVGGGNTFLLLKTLYEKNLLELLRKRVLEDGLLYMGSSAGTNVACLSINNTNDMPIVHPPSFEALKLIPFNINPHYLDTDENSKHKGETREERILQYQELEDSNVVLGMREGATLLITGQKAILKGIHGARLFIRGEAPKEIPVGTDLSHLLVQKRI